MQNSFRIVKVRSVKRLHFTCIELTVKKIAVIYNETMVTATGRLARACVCVHVAMCVCACPWVEISIRHAARTRVVSSQLQFHQPCFPTTFNSPLFFISLRPISQFFEVKCDFGEIVGTRQKCRRRPARGDRRQTRKQSKDSPPWRCGPSVCCRPSCRRKHVADPSLGRLFLRTIGRMTRGAADSLGRCFRNDSYRRTAAWRSNQSRTGRSIATPFSNSHAGNYCHEVFQAVWMEASLARVRRFKTKRNVFFLLLIVM